MYFNSQPHKEADVGVTEVSFVFHISTHSLTRRLTVFKWELPEEWDISTHSLKRRLTIKQHYVFLSFPISTHSLTRRLTRTLHQHGGILIFQLTASQGG